MMDGAENSGESPTVHDEHQKLDRYDVSLWELAEIAADMGAVLYYTEDSISFLPRSQAEAQRNRAGLVIARILDVRDLRRKNTILCVNIHKHPHPHGVGAEHAIAAAEHVTWQAEWNSADTVTIYVDACPTIYNPKYSNADDVIWEAEKKARLQGNRTAVIFPKDATRIGTTSEWVQKTLDKINYRYEETKTLVEVDDSHTEYFW